MKKDYKFVHIEADDPKDLVEVLNKTPGCEPISIVARGTRMLAFCAVPSDVKVASAAEPCRPKAALEFEAKMKALAAAQAGVVEEQKPKKERKKKEVVEDVPEDEAPAAEAPGPVVE
jgi:hypothetical protein